MPLFPIVGGNSPAPGSKSVGELKTLACRGFPGVVLLCVCMRSRVVGWEVQGAAQN